LFFEKVTKQWGKESTEKIQLARTTPQFDAKWVGTDEQYLRFSQS
jgi:hypothetical protein